MIDLAAIRVRWEVFGSKLDERGRRLFAAAEVRAVGRGGLAVVSEITGLARSTINRGEDDLDAAPLPIGRIRGKGGGRHALGDEDPGLHEALRRLVDPDTFGDPMRPLVWVSKSLKKLATACPFSGVLHPWARAGHHRFPGNPSHALALLHDPGRADKTSPLTVSSMLPPGTENRRPQRVIISRLTQGFSIRCLRFKSGVAAAPARLASGWLAAPLPGGGRTLWTASKGFRLHRHPPFQDFACRNQCLFRRSWTSS